MCLTRDAVPERHSYLSCGETLPFYRRRSSKKAHKVVLSPDMTRVHGSHVVAWDAVPLTPLV